MASNPEEEPAEPTFREQVEDFYGRTVDTARKQPILLAFVAGEVIGFILGRL